MITIQQLLRWPQGQDPYIPQSPSPYPEINTFDVDLRAFAKQPTVISVLLVDASSSTKRFGNTPKNAINELIEDLQKDRRLNGTNHVVSLVTFSHDLSVKIPPTAVQNIRGYYGHQTGYGSLFYRSAKRVFMGLWESWKTLSYHERMRLQIVVTVITDGEDNLSPSDDYPEALLEYVALAKQARWKLACYGLGINAEYLARRIGFPTEFAETLGSSPQAFQQATRRASGHARTRRP